MMNDTKMTDRNAPRTPAGTARLTRLDDLDDYKVADGEPDVRGWDVKGADGRKLGEVKSLIVDPAAREVRFLEVQLDKDLFPDRKLSDDERRVCIPIGAARLDRDNEKVLVDRLPMDRLAGAPRYGRERITTDRERALGDYYGNTGEQPAHRDNAKHLTLSEEQLAVGRRKVEAGEVTVHKTVETEHVKQQVPTMHEEVSIERHPARAGASNDVQIGEDEVRIPVMAEEVVVEKRAVPTEEIVVSKHAVRGEKTVEADLKREKVNVDKQGEVRESPTR